MAPPVALVLLGATTGIGLLGILAYAAYLEHRNRNDGYDEAEWSGLWYEQRWQDAQRRQKEERRHELQEQDAILDEDKLDEPAAHGDRADEEEDAAPMALIAEDGRLTEPAQDVKSRHAYANDADAFDSLFDDGGRVHEAGAGMSMASSFALIDDDDTDKACFTDSDGFSDTHSE